MKNWAFHSLLRWKMIALPVLTTSLIPFSLEVGENILLGVKGLSEYQSLNVQKSHFPPLTLPIFPRLDPWPEIHLHWAWREHESIDVTGGSSRVCIRMAKLVRWLLEQIPPLEVTPSVDHGPGGWVLKKSTACHDYKVCPEQSTL